MHTTFPRRHDRGAFLPARAAIVWIDRRRAIVTQADPRGQLHVREFSLPETADTSLAAFGEVVNSVLEAERLVVLGTPEMRAALEREYEAIAATFDRPIPTDQPTGREGA